MTAVLVAVAATLRRLAVCGRKERADFIATSRDELTRRAAAISRPRRRHKHQVCNHANSEHDHTPLFSALVHPLESREQEQCQLRIVPSSRLHNDENRKTCLFEASAP